MSITFEHRGQLFQSSGVGKSIAIDLEFSGAQPNHFGAPGASSAPLQAGSFVGATQQGGSCNVVSIDLVPHCNGTHTETVQHIVSQQVPVGRILTHSSESLMLAVLITVQTTAPDQTDEAYRPPLEENDLVITASAIKRAIALYQRERPTALIVRTQPNPLEKRYIRYGSQFQPPFFTVDAIQTISELEIDHLLVDLPSIDRMYDQGLLTNHHLFWQVVEGTNELGAETRIDKTITELIYVDESISDGLYLLNLQIPAWLTDAAPSRPILWPAEKL